MFHQEHSSKSDRTIHFSVLTASDASARGEREDVSGDLIVRLMKEAGFKLQNRLVLPDQRDAIANILAAWCDEGKTDAAITTGGTGLSPRDVTPDATADIYDYEVPGIAEAMRAKSLLITPLAMISRAKAAVRSKTLIVNLPGSPKAVSEMLPIVLDVLPHAIDILNSPARSN